MKKCGTRIEDNCIETWIEEVAKLPTTNPVYAVAYKALRDEGHDISRLAKPQTDVKPTEEDWEKAIPIMTGGEVSKDYLESDYRFYRWAYANARYPIDPTTHRRFV